eukprot:TRINITY_DN8781_c0_g1_i1.p1 TRINITY_DN8781_c0_g1~~TRINITY_DN8781_c0_g1_i1.p1  ORF type:complete len:194 (-),score=28.29 TRINITY_DN8781_c0_g1_i1:76-657(-)
MGYTLKISVVVLFGFISVVFGALPYIDTSCTVTGNDYDGLCKNPQGTGHDTPTNNTYIQPWSCVYNSNDYTYLGRINVTYTDSQDKLVVAIACSTKNCIANSPSIPDDWLTEYAIGTKINDCYYDPNNGGVVILDADILCNNVGTYDADTSICDCSDGYKGDDCSQVIHTSLASQTILSMFVLTFVLVGLIFL